MCDKKFLYYYSWFPILTGKNPKAGCLRGKSTGYQRKQVDIPNPLSLDVGEEVKIDKISDNRVRIYLGCRIYGEGTVIAPGVQLGKEGPVTIEDFQHDGLIPPET